jgi:hypothetical protein
MLVISNFGISLIYVKLICKRGKKKNLKFEPFEKVNGPTFLLYERMFVEGW